MLSLTMLLNVNGPYRNKWSLLCCQYYGGKALFSDMGILLDYAQIIPVLVVPVKGFCGLKTSDGMNLYCLWAAMGWILTSFVGPIGISAAAAAALRNHVTLGLLWL